MFARTLFKGFLLIMSILAFALVTATAEAGTAETTTPDEPICGSVEAFNRTHRWQDLPGCTEKRDYEDSVSPVTLLGRAKDSFKSFFEHWEKGEIDQADSYAGGCYEYTNGADDVWDSNPELAAARPAYEEMKRTVKQYMEWAPLVEELAQTYFNTATWIEEARKGVPEAPKTAEGFAKELQRVMEKASAARVPETFVVPGIGLVKPATVAEIKTMIQPFLGQAAEAIVKEKEADDLKWKPYTSLLGGDRLKFFNESYRIGTNVYGPGGKYLDTPQEFRDTPLMCTMSYTTDQLVERWSVYCYSFRGNKQVSGPRTTRGYGSAPPSAFR